MKLDIQRLAAGLTGGAAIRAPAIGVAPQLWHGHEKIFGYGVAVLAGFS